MRYLKIDNCNMNNGDGLRCVLWVSGCHHNCPGCFNPETWDFENGDLLTEEEYNFIRETVENDWCSGVTLSGGDPFAPENREDIMELMRKLKVDCPDKTIWVYTGYVKEELPEKLLENVDVLCDGRFVEALKDPYVHWVGSTNQRVLKLKGD